MSKQEFLYRLETLLMDLPKDERDDALDYYEQYFEAAGPEREEEVLRELGSPEKVSEMIHFGGTQDGSGRRVYDRPMAPPRRSRAPLWIALGVIGGLFALSLVLGIVNFSALPTTSTTITKVQVDNQEDLDDQIDHFVGGVLDSVMDRVGDGLEEGVGAVLNDGIFEGIEQEIDQSLGEMFDGSEGWDGMAGDYAQDAAVLPDGTVALKAHAPMAWENVRNIELELASAAVLFREVDGDTVQVESSLGDRVQVSAENGTLTVKNTGDAEKGQDDTIVIFLPRGTKLLRLDAELDSGYVETGNLQVEEVNVSLPDGVWKSDGTVTAQKVTMEMEDGCVAIGEMTAGRFLAVSLQDGVLKAERLESPKITLECGDGMLRAGLAGAKEDYSWNASVGSGILEIGGETSWKSMEKEQGEWNLTVSVGEGAAKISFEE